MVAQFTIRKPYFISVNVKLKWNDFRKK